MAALENRRSIAQTIRALPAGATSAGEVDPNQPVNLTIRLHRQTPHAKLHEAIANLTATPPAARNHFSRPEFAQKFGADPANIHKVEEFAKHNGLTVEESSPERRSVRVSGSADAVRKAFGATMERYEHLGDQYHRRTSEITLPDTIAPLVEAVIGFDNRPYARPHFQIAAPPTGAVTAHASGGFKPNDLGPIYGFPGGDGDGQVVGIIELMMPHGSGFRPTELQQYFTSLGVNTPEVVVVSVDGGQNIPGTNPNDPKCGDGEVMLDIEVVGALAPKAKIVVYFAPNTAQGFLDVISRAVHDNVNKPSVISLSWGSAEDPSDPTTMQIHQVLTAAAAMGITFCVASGDNGSRDDPDHPDRAAVDFPASSPFALACGGTNLTASSTTITSEVAWSGSGGGISRIFDLPSYQSSAHVPPAVNPSGPTRRGVPDVSAVADPDTGYRILVDGQHMVMGGTSAVAPLWGAMVARLNQKLGRSVGLLQPFLYAHPKVCNDITSGNNIDYASKPGWDPCTGLGSPDGTKILNGLSHANTNS